MIVKVGDLVVMNDLLDATLYRVDDIGGFLVHLSYISGNCVVGGARVDKSMCQSPNKDQLIYNMKETFMTMEK
jgi:hypothetical protein